MIFDTDVVIWYLRGNKKAYKLLDEEKYLNISSITYMELLQSTRNKKELIKTDKALSKIGIEIIRMNQEISEMAEQLVKDFALSHGTELTDALIAATCIFKKQTLCTANDKHYRHIEDLDIEVFRPE